MNGLFSLGGKVALVTGGSRGIGFMIAGQLLDAGADRVYICARRAEACDAAAAELSARAKAEPASSTGRQSEVGGPALREARCVSIPADLEKPEDVDRLAARLQEREKRLHILVNNAGVAWGAPVDTHPIEQIDRVLAVNVRAVFQLTQRLLPLLRAAASPEDPARVINIGSIDGLSIPIFQNYGYSASKAAVHMLTRHLAHALVSDHITVNSIAPGLFPTRMTRTVFESPAAAEAVVAEIPMRRAGTAEDVGGTAVYLASRAGAYLTGVVIPVAGGLSTIDTHGRIDLG
ncbi:MAG TPA: SDR family oxidoreductase [Candidatus Dormibacteraeota bacterium]|nr:SDR family oxidoreductase [Candidatus Dormibacteraeota bacterium]